MATLKREQYVQFEKNPQDEYQSSISELQGTKRGSTSVRRCKSSSNTITRQDRRRMALLTALTPLSFQALLHRKIAIRECKYLQVVLTMEPRDQRTLSMMKFKIKFPTPVRCILDQMEKKRAIAAAEVKHFEAVNLVKPEH